MLVVRARNVQEAYVQGTNLVRRYGVTEMTRNGPAFVVPSPVTTVYERPLERVLLDPVRNANPFFHLMESIWMLAGRSDVDSIGEFLGALKKYSDDGVSYHGAYGYRWRHHFQDDDTDHYTPELDQLRRIIELLRKNPMDRRIVLQMWDATTDLGCEGLDFPCNTQIYFRARKETHIRRDPRVHPVPPASAVGPTGDYFVDELVLDMTICCRSNDAIMGAFGANAVHFSVLQEFVAAASGLAMGHMYQISNNLHAYVGDLDRVDVPVLRHVVTTIAGQDYSGRLDDYTIADAPRSDPGIEPTPLFRRDATTDLDEVFRVIGQFWDGTLPGGDAPIGQFSGPGLHTLLVVRQAHRSRRTDPASSLRSLATLPNLSDWRRACTEWLERRAGT